MAELIAAHTARASQRKREFESQDPATPAGTRARLTMGADPAGAYDVLRARVLSPDVLRRVVALYPFSSRVWSLHLSGACFAQQGAGGSGGETPGMCAIRRWVATGPPSRHVAGLAVRYLCGRPWSAAPAPGATRSLLDSSRELAMLVLSKVGDDSRAQSLWRGVVASFDGTQMHSILEEWFGALLQDPVAEQFWRDASALRSKCKQLAASGDVAGMADAVRDTHKLWAERADALAGKSRAYNPSLVPGYEALFLEIACHRFLKYRVDEYALYWLRRYYEYLRKAAPDARRFGTVPVLNRMSWLLELLDAVSLCRMPGSDCIAALKVGVVREMYGHHFQLTEQQASEASQSLLDELLSHEWATPPHYLVIDKAMCSIRKSDATPSSVRAACTEILPLADINGDLAQAVLDVVLAATQSLAELHQFKQVVLVFEEALQKPTLQKMALAWREYISFSVKREKWINARILYCRAVVTLDDPSAMLEEFCAFERSRGATDISPEELLEMAKQRKPSRSMNRARPKLQCLQCLQCLWPSPYLSHRHLRLLLLLWEDVEKLLVTIRKNEGIMKKVRELQSQQEGVLAGLAQERKDMVNKHAVDSLGLTDLAAEDMQDLLAEQAREVADYDRSGSFFRGTSLAQDGRFTDKEEKLLKKMVFPANFNIKVDIKKVNMDQIRRWITRRVTELLGFEDEVLCGMIASYLEEPDMSAKRVQFRLTSFLEESTAPFMAELWDLLLAAQEAPGGVPPALLEQKRSEIARHKEEVERISSGIRATLERIDKSDPSVPAPPPAAPAASPAAPAAPAPAPVPGTAAAATGAAPAEGEAAARKHGSRSRSKSRSRSRSPRRHRHDRDRDRDREHGHRGHRHSHGRHRSRSRSGERERKERSSRHSDERR
eukprot:m51a1_g6257 hypothetical protein (892) ;mRNA; f:101029-105777